MSEGRSFTTTFKTKAETDGISKMQEELKNLKTSLRDNKKEQKELSKEIRDAKAEITAINKEIKQTGTATEEQQAKLKKLQAVVENDTKALESLKLQQAQLQSQMGETTKKIDAQKKAMDKFKSSMKDAKKYGTELVKEIGAIGAAATAAVAGLFAFTKEAAQWADDMNTLSKVTGIGTDELQKFAYASDLIDVSMDTLTGSLTKLTRTMQSASQGGTSAAAQAFQELGVSVTDSTGQLRDRQEVFYETIDALGRIANETERDALAMNIFGKSAQELNPLIKGGAETLKTLGDEAERAGLILSQATLDNLNEFNNKVDLLKAKGEQIKNLAASEMTPALDGLVEVADDLLDEISEMAKSGELKKMAKEAGEMIKTAAEALKNLLKFVWDNKEAIGALVVQLVAFSMAMKVANLVQSLVSGFKALKVAEEGATVAQTGLNAAMSANPMGALLTAGTAVIGVIEALVIAFNTCGEEVEIMTAQTENYLDKLEKLEESRDSVTDSAEKEAVKLNLLKNEYDELRNAAYLTLEQKERLNTVAGQLAEAMNINISQLREESGAYKDLTQELDEYIKKLKEKAIYDYYGDVVAESAVAMEKLKEPIIQAKKEFEEAEKELDEIRKYRTPDGSWLTFTYNGNTVGADYFEDEYNRLKSVKELARQKLSEYNVQYQEAEEAMNGAEKALGNMNITTEESAKVTEISTETLEKYRNQAVSAADTFKKVKDEIEKNGKLSLSTLSDITKKYPELNDLVDQYCAGLKTEKEVLEGLEKAYKKDAENYAQAMLLKNQSNEDFYNSAIKKNTELVNKFKEQYDVDLSNFKSLAEAKAAIIEALKKKYFELFDEEGYTISNNGNVQTLIKGNKVIADSYDNQRTWKLKKSEYADELKHYINTHDTYIKASWSDSGFNELFAAEAAKYYTPTLLTENGTASSSSKSAASSAKAAEKAVNELFERQKLALAAYKRLVENQIDLEKQKADAAKKSADEQIAALDKLSKKRKQDQEDEKRQKELDAVNTRLTYDRLTQFERRELLRKKQDILNEQADAEFDRDIEARKAAISAGSQSAQDRSQAVIDRLKASETQLSDRIAYLQGTQSYDQRVQNNSRTVNVQIVQNGLSADQTARRIVDKVIKELG